MWCCTDIGGQDKIRPLWRHYYQQAHGIIFVVDSMDRERIETAEEELSALLGQPELKKASVLVLANKQDLPGAMSAKEVTSKLGLKFGTHREWNVQGCSAVDGEGLYEGFQWMSESLSKRSN